MPKRTAVDGQGGASIRLSWRFEVRISVCGFLEHSTTMPTTLSRAIVPNLRAMNQLIVIRMVTSTPNAPKPATMTTQEIGYLRYERDRSRDPRARDPQKPGDTPMRFLLRRLGHAYEVYPLIGIVSFWVTILCVVTWASFDKIEVWLDRSKHTAPYDWERARDGYWKKHTVLFDMFGNTHNRLEIMEKLQDEMIEAAKKRGTR